MYGVPCKLVLTKKNGRDEVFGDFTHLTIDNTKTFQIYGMPENAESFDTQNYMFGDYGISTYDVCNIFVSTYDFDEKHSNLKLNEIVGNLLVLPSGKVMEITNVDFMTPNVNNLFAYADKKSVYKLSLHPYAFKLQDDINHDILQPTAQGDSEFKNINEVQPDKVLEEAHEEYENVLETGETIDGIGTYNKLMEDINDTLGELADEEDDMSEYNALDNYFDRLVKVKENVDHEVLELTGTNTKTVKSVKDTENTVSKGEVSETEKKLNPKTPTELVQESPIGKLTDNSSNMKNITKKSLKANDLDNISAIKVQENENRPIYPKRRVSKFNGF
jgi:hypothetical protein